MQNEASTLSSDTDMPAAFPSLVRKVLPGASNATLAQIQSLYSWPTGFPQQLAWDWTGDEVFFCPALSLAETYADRTYRYIMSVPPAVHAQDLSYYFYPHFNYGLKASETTARAMQRFIGDFIYGKEMKVTLPSKGSITEVVWRSFAEQTSLLNITSSGFEVARADEVRMQRCKVLDGIFEDQANGI